MSAASEGARVAAHARPFCLCNMTNGLLKAGFCACLALECSHMQLRRRGGRYSIFLGRTHLLSGGAFIIAKKNAT